MSALLPVVPELTPECLADRATQGPRYTSYPPATELGSIAQATVRRELALIGRTGLPVSLYVHVPFCQSLCWYCGCNVVPTRDRTRGDVYVESLATELALLADALGPGFPVSEIALGGGSPNFLQPATIRRLMAVIDRYFTIQRGARRSVELDPRTTVTSHLEAFAQAGFTSMSMGIQDFSEPVQDAIHRHQSVAQTRWLVERARTFGFTDVNADIVYGLPRQNEASFEATLDAVISLEADRIALFGYAHLPAKLPHQRLVERAGRVLDRYERATLLLLGIDKLVRAGYEYLGLDHFARPDSRLAAAAREGRLARTFQGYVERQADSVIGVGASAISTTSRAIWQNHTDLAAWEHAIDERELPVARGLQLDDDDRIRRAVIGKLMCDGEVELGAIERELDVANLPAYFARELAELPADLASYDASSRRVVTTGLGRVLVRNVCMVFDRYQRAPGAFSPTI